MRCLIANCSLGIQVSKYRGQVVLVRLAYQVANTKVRDTVTES